jgi:hypothetical protein
MLRLNDRVQLVSPGDVGEDAHGNPTVDWDSEPVRVSPALVTPLSALTSSSENTIGGQVTITRWRLFLPAVVPIDARSRVRWRGDEFDVEGDVELHTDTRGRPHHQEALMVRVTG